MVMDQAVLVILLVTGQWAHHALHGHRYFVPENSSC